MKNKDRPPKPIVERPIRIIINKVNWIEIRVKMLRYRITFQSIAKKFGISRQRVHAIVKHGYPTKGRAKQILDYFYGRLSG